MPNRIVTVIYIFLLLFIVVKDTVFFATKSIPLNLSNKKGKPVISAHMFIATCSEHKTNAIEIKSCHVTSIKTYRKLTKSVVFIALMYANQRFLFPFPN